MSTDPDHAPETAGGSATPGHAAQEGAAQVGAGTADGGPSTAAESAAGGASGEAARSAEDAGGSETAGTAEAAETGEDSRADRKGGHGGHGEHPDAGDAGDAGEKEADSGTTDAAEGEGPGELSEAEEELAAQRALRERIARRKAEREEPIASGGKLNGQAADLLAAVRAVESGARPARAVFDEDGPGPAPRRVAPAPPPPAPAAPVPAAAVSADEVRAVGEVLAEGGAPAALAPRTAAALGADAAGQLRADPWQLLRVDGVRPDQADGFARSLLGPECGPDDERRGRALVVWLLEQAAVAGHTALDEPALGGALGRYGVGDSDAAVRDAVVEGDVLVFQDALDPAARPDGARAAQEPGAGPDEEGSGAPVTVLFGLERYALAEESLADGLARLLNSVPGGQSEAPGPADRSGAAPDAAAWETAAAGAGGSAAELLRAVAAHGLVLHTGGEAARAEPAALLTAAAALGLRVCAATHTADGRRRFARLLDDGAQETDGRVATVSGLLSGAEGPGRDGEGALAVDLLVVLDAPQLDVETAAVLVESLPDGARLVLSGDPAVLWSAGPGRVFADLLAARVCPQIASRTPDPGPIGELVSGIGAGELEQVAAPGKEVVIVPVREAAEAVHRTVQLVADSVPRAFGVSAEEIQVITPGHGGAAGTRALNAALKERLNPGPGRFGGFDPGDRVAYAAAPGRMTPGRVVGADAEGLRLECEGGPVVVPKERVEESVRHGWALTAHQAVGLRRPAAVVVLPGDAAKALTRSWVYTAFSRGERHLSVVHGVEQALPHAVAQVPAKPRTTRLTTLLRPRPTAPE